MAVQEYEQRPPRALAVQFDGENAAEVCALVGIETPPEVTVGGEGDPDRAQGQPMIRLDLYGWGPQYVTVMVLGDYLVRQDSGAKSVMQPDTFAAQFRAVQ